jgi:hypothetical protein
MVYYLIIKTTTMMTNAAARPKVVYAYRVKIGNEEMLFDVGTLPVSREFPGYEGKNLKIISETLPNGDPQILLECNKALRTSMFNPITIQFRPADCKGAYFTVKTEPIGEVEKQRSKLPLITANVEPKTDPPPTLPPPPVLPPQVLPPAGVVTLDDVKKHKKKKQKLQSKIDKKVPMTKIVYIEKKNPLLPPPWPDEPNESEDGKHLCRICLERDSCCMIKPCRHAVICVRCAIQDSDKLKGKCPICRGKIERIKRVYPIFYS